MTDAEKLLWEYLRDKQLGVRFRRQHPIGPYIVDFATFSGRVAIEVDGSTHTDFEKEAVRDAELVSRGWRVLHFRNADVFGEPGRVVSLIRRVVEKRTEVVLPRSEAGPPSSPPSSPLPRSEAEWEGYGEGGSQHLRGDGTLGNEP
ncbi:MAG: endonuclease domain-containing protein [Acidimicrobiia bacterium]|nr:endonuclease domain-containing protein [Acidimicrobiia bacterium]